MGLGERHDLLSDLGNLAAGQRRHRQDERLRHLAAEFLSRQDVTHVRFGIRQTRLTANSRGLTAPRRHTDDANVKHFRASVALLLLVFDRYPRLREVLMLAEITGVHKDVLSTTLWSDETVTACLVETHDLAHHSHHSTT